MKKIFCLIFSIIIFLNIFTIIAFANDVEFSGENISCRPGDTIDVTFYSTDFIPNYSYDDYNIGIGTLDLSVTYDKNIFKYYDHNYDYPFTKGGLAAINKDEPGVFKFAFVSSDGTNKGGKMLTITFKVSDNAVIGESYNINFNVNSITDNYISMNKLSANNVTTVVKIGGYPPNTVLQKPYQPSQSNNNDNSKVIFQTSSVISASSVSSQENSVIESSSESTKSSSLTYSNNNTITNDATNTDIESNTSSLYTTTIIVLSVVAFLLIAVMIVLIIQYLYDNKKGEKI